MCQCRPSASVHSGEKMICKAGTDHPGGGDGVKRARFWLGPPSIPTSGQGDTNLITRLAARAQAFSMVAPTVDLAGVIEVDEVNQQLLARGAHKALGVPTGTQACATGKDCDVPASDLLSTLPKDRHYHSHQETQMDGGQPSM